jgi:addiction module HigA family antidote
MPLHNPPHPGETLREDVLPTLKLSITALAKHLGYSRVQLSSILHGKYVITADLAWRLELAGLGKASMWLARQSAYDLWQAQLKDIPAITRLVAA